MADSIELIKYPGRKKHDIKYVGFDCSTTLINTSFPALESVLSSHPFILFQTLPNNTKNLLFGFSDDRRHSQLFIQHVHNQHHQYVRDLLVLLLINPQTEAIEDF